MAACVAAAAFAAAAAVPGASAKTGGAYWGVVHGPIPLTNVQDQSIEDSHGIILQKTGTTYELWLHVYTFCIFAKQPPYSPPNSGYTTGEGYIFRHVHPQANGSFHVSGAINGSTIVVRGKPGGTVTVTGKITATQTTGTFSRTAYVDQGNKCRPVSVSWKAPYDPAESFNMP